MAKNIEKYTIAQGLKDFVKAAKSNKLSFVGATATSYLTTGILYLIVSLTFAVLLLAEFARNIESVFRGGSASIAFIAMVAVFTYAVLLALVKAFTSASLAFALVSPKKKYSKVMISALKSIPRVVMAILLVDLIAFAPFIVLMLVSTAIAFIGSSTVDGGTGVNPLIFLVPIIVIGAVVWAYIAYLRYALVPYVAMFEPKITFKNLLKRGKSLTDGGGQWFVFKGVLIFIGLAILFNIILENIDDNGWLSEFISLILLALLVLALVIAQGALAVFYFNRKKLIK